MINKQLEPNYCCFIEQYRSEGTTTISNFKWDTKNGLHEEKFVRSAISSSQRTTKTNTIAIFKVKRFTYVPATA